jgi:hypothetical protein
MNRPGRQQVSLAVSCLLCFLLALRNTKGLEGTEFSGGWLTGPLLSMIEIGTVLFALALIVAFLSSRIAAGIALVSSLLCLPLNLYLIVPVYFNQLFGSAHEFKVLPGRNFHLDVWAIAGLLSLAVTGYLCLHGFRRNGILTSDVRRLPSL